MEFDQLSDVTGKIVGQLLIGDPVDLPSDLAERSIAALVLLRLQPSTMPGHMVDLDGPLHVEVNAIGMHPNPVRQAYRMLPNERTDASALERAENSQFET